MLRIEGKNRTDPDSYIVKPVAIEAYFIGYQQLVRDFPECWHLCVQAEDRCRAEHFARLGRKLAAKTGSIPSWSDVFVAAAEDYHFWSQEVRHPAVGFLARGVRSRPATQTTSAPPGTSPQITDGTITESAAKRRKQRQKE